jgi:hypothetical protein
MSSLIQDKRIRRELTSQFKKLMEGQFSPNLCSALVSISRRHNSKVELVLTFPRAVPLAGAASETERNAKAEIAEKKTEVESIVVLARRVGLLGMGRQADVEREWTSCQAYIYVARMLSNDS